VRPHPHLFEVSAWSWLERLSREERRHVTLAEVPGRVGMAWRRSVRHRLSDGSVATEPDREAHGPERPSLRAEYDRALPDWRLSDVPSSPYCIQAYEPGDRMGGWRGFDDALHRRGMRLVVDFVPNHFGFDHAWVSAHPERFVLGTPSDQLESAADFRPVERGDEVWFVARGRDPYFAPWRDEPRGTPCSGTRRDGGRSAAR
jgi:Alpha amylase, catalytic domain